MKGAVARAPAEADLVARRVCTAVHAQTVSVHERALVRGCETRLAVAPRDLTLLPSADISLHVPRLEDLTSPDGLLGDEMGLGTRWG